MLGTDSHGWRAQSGGVGRERQILGTRLQGLCLCSWGGRDREARVWGAGTLARTVYLQGGEDPLGPELLRSGGGGRPRGPTAVSTRRALEWVRRELVGSPAPAGLLCGRAGGTALSREQHLEEPYWGRGAELAGAAWGSDVSHGPRLCDFLRTASGPGEVWGREG